MNRQVVWIGNLSIQISCQRLGCPRATTGRAIGLEQCFGTLGIAGCGQRLGFRQNDGGLGVVDVVEHICSGRVEREAGTGCIKQSSGIRIRTKLCELLRFVDSIFSGGDLRILIGGGGGDD